MKGNDFRMIGVLVLILVLLFWNGRGYGEEKEKFATIKDLKEKIKTSYNIKNGLNYIDLNGDGKEDIIVKGYRNNISAHGFSVISFYINQKNEYKKEQWLGIVSINERSPIEERYVLFTHEGADCVLRDFRLIKVNNSIFYYLLIAERQVGKSYISRSKVKFLLYKLNFDEVDDRFFFRKLAEFESSGAYCDVNEAFKKELGM